MKCFIFQIRDNGVIVSVLLKLWEHFEHLQDPVSLKLCGLHCSVVILVRANEVVRLNHQSILPLRCSKFKARAMFFKLGFSQGSLQVVKLNP